MVRTVSLSLLWIALSTISAASAEIYDFVERDTGNILAEMELDTLPALAPDVNYFEFTPKGLEWVDLNFGQSTPPELRSKLFFNSASSPQATIIDDGVSGLRSSTDEVTTFVRFFLFPVEYYVNLNFLASPTPAAGILDGTDNIDISIFPDGGPMFATVPGNWVKAATVPEPSSLVMGPAAFAAWAVIGPGRRRRTEPRTLT